jgi:predicted esterase
LSGDLNHPTNRPKAALFEARRPVAVPQTAILFVLEHGEAEVLVLPATEAVQADLMTRGASVTGEDSPSGHIVAERTLDLGHASASAEKGQLELFVLVGKGLTGLVDRRVQLAG